MGHQGNAVRAPAPTAGPSRREVNRRLGIRQDDFDICGWGYSLPGLNGGPASVLSSAVYHARLTNLLQLILWL